jgi:hypothetical protein
MKPKKQRIDRRAVRAWMVMEGLRPLDIQKALGFRYHTQVVETILGDRDDRRVLTWLRDNGCPADSLKLPTDMQEKHS